MQHRSVYAMDLVFLNVVLETFPLYNVFKYATNVLLESIIINRKMECTTMYRGPTCAVCSLLIQQDRSTTCFTVWRKTM